MIRQRGEKMENCIFCRIIAGDIPSSRIYEDEDCIAMLDISPASPGHTLILPKEHRKDLTEMDGEALGKLMTVAKIVGIRQMERLNAAGFNLVQNNGTAAGQTVPHFHIHVIPRYEGGPAIAAWEPTSPDFDELAVIRERLSD